MFDDRCWSNGRDTWRAGLAHHDFRFTSKNGEHCFNAILSECCEAPSIRTSDTYRGCTESQCLEHISASTNAAVQQYGNSSLHCLYNFGKGLNSRAQRLFPAPAMIGDNNPVGSVLDRQLRIFPRDDPLDKKLHFGRIFQAIHKVPSQAGGM